MTPEERGRYIVEAIHREAHRIHRLTESTKLHNCHLLPSQQADYDALKFSEDRPWRWRDLGLPGIPFEIDIYFDRTTPIEGVELEECQ